MSGNPNAIDEDKIFMLLQKASLKAQTLKDQYGDLINLINQLSGISKNTKGELAKSKLTNQVIKPELRKIIYDESLVAALRLKVE